MGSTNKTTNYELSQFVGTDKPSWLGDYNADMGKIDLAIKARAVEAGQAQASADTANGKADALDTRMDTAEDNILALQNASTTDHTQIATNTANISKNAQDIVQLDAKIGHTQITIGDHTVTGAIAELAQGGGITVDDAESTTSENPLQNKVITVAMNAVRGLMTAIQNLLGSTNISSIGDGTVTGAISALSQSSGGNVRWNETTDRFEVLKNGSWVQSIRAFVNSIAVLVNGVFGIAMSDAPLGLYENKTATPFTVTQNGLSATYTNASYSYCYVSDEKIDVTNYAAIKVTANGTEYTANISNVSGLHYLLIGVYTGTSATSLNTLKLGLVNATSSVPYMLDNSNVVTMGTETLGTPATVNITEITIE